MTTPRSATEVTAVFQLFTMDNQELPPDYMEGEPGINANTSDFPHLNKTVLVEVADYDANNAKFESCK